MPPTHYLSNPRGGGGGAGGVAYKDRARPPPRGHEAVTQAPKVFPKRSPTGLTQHQRGSNPTGPRLLLGEVAMGSQAPQPSQGLQHKAFFDGQSPTTRPTGHLKVDTPMRTDHMVPHGAEP